MLFIGGTGRCGTSITRRVLGQHAKVATLPFEYRFLIDPDGIIDFWKTYSNSWSPYLADRRIKRLERFLAKLSKQSYLSRLLDKCINALGLKSLGVLTTRQYSGWALNNQIPGFDEINAELIHHLCSFKYAGSWVGAESYSINSKLYHAPSSSSEILLSVLQNYCWLVINRLLQKQECEFYIEDNTWNCLFATELLELFPGAKFLHVYRDPRDVVTSLIRQRWAPADIGQACQFYGDVMSKWFVIREGIDKSQLVEIAMEDLINNTKSTLDSIGKCTGLSFDNMKLQVSLTKSSIGRWRRELSANQQAELNDRLSQYIEEFGYE